MPDSGHGSHFQFPEEFAEAAARFLAADWHPKRCPWGDEIGDQISIKAFSLDTFKNGALHFGDMPKPALPENDVKVRIGKEEHERVPSAANRLDR